MQKGDRGDMKKHDAENIFKGAGEAVEKRRRGKEIKKKLRY